MQRHTRIRIQDAADFIREEGGCNEIIALGLQKIVEALNDEMDDEELMIPDDSDDIVVDGPEPGETMEQLNRKTIEQPNEKRRKRKQEAAETVTADSGSLYTSQSRNLAISQSESKSRNLALTPEQITTGRAKILRLIQQRTPPDIPTLVRACIDDGMTASDLSALTGLGYHTIAKCKTGVVTSTVTGRFQELFAFPREPVTQEEE